jgi:hypothetical protein
MSDEEKRNGGYEKPESHRIGGDELDEVSGGGDATGGGGCWSGSSPADPGCCGKGDGVSFACKEGHWAGGCSNGTKP